MDTMQILTIFARELEHELRKEAEIEALEAYRLSQHLNYKFEFNRLLRQEKKLSKKVFEAKKEDLHKELQKSLNNASFLASVYESKLEEHIKERMPDIVQAIVSATRRLSKLESDLYDLDNKVTNNSLINP